MGDKCKNWSDQPYMEGATGKEGKERGEGQTHGERESGEQEVEEEDRAKAASEPRNPARQQPSDRGPPNLSNFHSLNQW